MNIHDHIQLESAAAHIARTEIEARETTSPQPTPQVVETIGADTGSVDYNPKSIYSAPPPFTVHPIFNEDGFTEKCAVVFSNGCATYGGKPPEEPCSVLTDDRFGVEYVEVEAARGDTIYCHFILESESESESESAEKVYKFLKLEFSKDENPESLEDNQDSLTFKVAKIGSENPRSVYQYITGALHVGGGGGGGGSGPDSSIEVEDNTVIVISVDYITSKSDEDWGEHQYAIRIRRGYLKINNGKLTVKEDTDLKRFIETTPYSGYYGGGSAST